MAAKPSSTDYFLNRLSKAARASLGPLMEEREDPFWTGAALGAASRATVTRGANISH
jgi:hypothetical protein